MSVLSVLLLILVSCSKKGVDEAVIFNPKDPKAGEKITVKFYPKRLMEPKGQKYTVYLIYQLFDSQGVKTNRVEMIKKNNYRKADIATKTGDYLLSLKFEDNMGRFEDKSGYGWNIQIQDNKGNVQRNSFYKLGSIYNKKERNINFPDYKKAIEYFNQELTLFPDNYKVWIDLWYSSLRLTTEPAKEFEKIKLELDSLLTNEPESADLLSLAFNAKLKFLNDFEEAQRISNRILSDYKNYDKIHEIAYAAILLRNKANTNAVINDLEEYVKKTKNMEYLKMAYYQLSDLYRQQKRFNEATAIFQKYLSIDSTNISIRLNLANNYVRNGNYKLAQRIIDNAKRLNLTDLNLQNNPWDSPEERESKSNLTQCQILSTQAALDFETKSYRSAIENRKKCLKFRTPFPAYEWEKIGDTYLRMAEIDSAQQAFIKAVSINSSQEGAIKKLKNLFQQNGKSAKNFDTFLKDAVQYELKISAKVAPSAGLIDLKDNNVNVSQQDGKIIVLVFWDSWSDACKREIPSLNELKDSYKKNSKVLFWAVSVEAPVSINKFIRETPFHFHLFHSGFDVKRKFNVIGFPTHIIIDAESKIRFTHVGFSNRIKSELNKEIQFLIDE